MDLVGKRRRMSVNSFRRMRQDNEEKRVLVTRAVGVEE